MAGKCHPVLAPPPGTHRTFLTQGTQARATKQGNETGQGQLGTDTGAQRCPPEVPETSAAALFPPQTPLGRLLLPPRACHPCSPSLLPLRTAHGATGGGTDRGDPRRRARVQQTRWKQRALTALCSAGHRLQSPTLWTKTEVTAIISQRDYEPQEGSGAQAHMLRDSDSTAATGEFQTHLGAAAIESGALWGCWASCLHMV